MTPRERRQYDAIHSIKQTLDAMREYHRHYVSGNLGAQFDAFNSALVAEMNRIRANAEVAEQARKNAESLPM